MRADLKVRIDLTREKFYYNFLQDFKWKPRCKVIKRSDLEILKDALYLQPHKQSNRRKAGVSGVLLKKAKSLTLK